MKNECLEARIEFKRKRRIRLIRCVNVMRDVVAILILLAALVGCICALLCFI